MSATPPEPRASLNLAERVKELEPENQALRSENAQIQRENQILEDAAAFFAARRKKQVSSNGSHLYTNMLKKQNLHCIAEYCA